MTTTDRERILANTRLIGQKLWGKEEWQVLVDTDAIASDDDIYDALIALEGINSKLDHSEQD